MAALFHPYLIKPSHYDNDGYVIQWFRRDRCSEMPPKPPLVFYPRYAWQVTSTWARLLVMYLQHAQVLKRALCDTGAHEDIAMAAVQENDFDSLELFNATPAAKIVVEKQRRKTASTTSVSSA